MDGVLADLEREYCAVDERLSGAAGVGDAAGPAEEEHADKDPEITRRELTLARRRRYAIWRAIKNAPEFWTTLQPTEADAVRRIQTLATHYKWDVVFITQRPATAGATVQRQTQRWLVQHGFQFPSVVVLNGSRGATVAALELDYLVDDTPKNCIDVMSECGAKLLLVTSTENDLTIRSAERLGITVVPTIGAALDLLETASKQLARATTSAFPQDPPLGI